MRWELPQLNRIQALLYLKETTPPPKLDPLAINCLNFMQELPEGWMVRRAVAQSGRVYFNYRSPAGVPFRSLALARAAAAPPDAVVAPPVAPVPVAAALVAGAHPANVGSLEFRFPDDLSEHAGYFDRPSRRPPPTSRR